MWQPMDMQMHALKTQVSLCLPDGYLITQDTSQNKSTGLTPDRFTQNLQGQGDI